VTAGGRVDGAGHVALEDDPVVGVGGRVRHRDRREQRLRVGVFRVGEQFRRLRHLDDFAEVHHGDAVGDVSDY
jgi:hypothetical protein